MAADPLPPRGRHTHMVRELHIPLKLPMIPIPPLIHIFLVLQPVDDSDNWNSVLADDLGNQVIVDAEKVFVPACRDTIEEEVDTLVVVGEVPNKTMDLLECLHRLHGALSAFVQARRVPYLISEVGIAGRDLIAFRHFCVATRITRNDGLRRREATQHFN